MANTQPLLSIGGLRKHYGSNEVLRGVDLDVHQGETVAILGPSGSGKSTFLRCINCLEYQDGGSIYLDGNLIGFDYEGSGYRRMSEKKIAAQRKQMGMVFQNFNLFPHWTVLRNLTEAPISVAGLSRTEAVERARKLLARVGLADREDAYPRQLSGGQQQRIAIARTLAMEPKLLLFDEPTSALDPANVGEVTDVMASLAKEGATMLVVTHEVWFARAAADRVVFIKDGVVVEEGPSAQVLDNPTHELTKDFLEKTGA